MSYSLYFHIPFCRHRCAYCDFNTYAGQEAQIPAYVDALCREIEFVARSSPQRLKVHTVFFGGGTPSLLSARQFEQIFKTIHKHFDLLDQTELETSLEANPGTLSLDYLRDLHALGFNRLSLGVQSSHPAELRQLERIHDFFDAIDAVSWARRAGFTNLNLDLIYGLPEQSLDRWSVTVKRAVALHPEHLSLYALTVEQGTPFGRWAAHGLMPTPDPDAAAEMYEWAAEHLEEQGYQQYEISNWAKPGLQCKHNLQYWRNQSYLGFGAGAHGCAAGVRYSNALRIKTYLDRIEKISAALEFPLSPAAVDQQQVSAYVEMQETMMLGLRLTREGVSAAEFAQRFGIQMLDVFGTEIGELIRQGLLEDVATPRGVGIPPIICLTKRGRLLGNQVFIRFVGN
jgi:oxygen-independent coproporphyrinogen-3 oxidase